MSEFKAVEEVIEANKQYVWTNTVLPLISSRLI